MKTLTHVQRVRMLYKMILRLHRGLPVEMQSLGNDYVHDEFRRHKTCNPTESHIFLNEWTDYALSLAKQLGLRGPKTSQPLGKSLTEGDLDKLKDEQLHQLYELMVAATGKSENKSDKS
ncbi:PREDICTED: succinate dehydrogenase assembly factor 3, mitochondrial [Polistes dominula]|uniref:Succinate dehydrogenase assembly factor 3 n=1 Tax=Polistes dominula TaxID=743375 RepID=A0ABM1IKL0_POLDO|nr:PREDICTED: succinate dehydrogenase assembly factor 3, mitochondrial [Polistes dominula]